MSGKRKYSCDYDYFESIDSNEKAYWLGFIMADGCILHTKRIRKLKTGDFPQERLYLQIALAEKDIDHLVKFSNSLKSTYPIHTYETKEKHKYCRVIIEDKKFCNDLIKLGATPAKSLTLEFPKNLDKKYILDFTRGYFDGDGCLSSHEYKYGNGIEYEFNITGTSEMLTTVLNILKLKITDKTLKQRYGKKNVNNYTAKYCGNLQAFRVMHLLYNNASVYLERKYNKYLELADLINSRLG